MIGPLDEEPRTVALLNDARTPGAAILAAVEALGRSLIRALESMVDFFKGLWGYHADFVDEDHRVIPASALNNLGAGARHWFTLSCDGRSEGSFLITGYVEGTADTGSFANGVPWRRFRVWFEDLVCLKESEWDRFTSSDEPFILGLVIPHGGTQPLISWRTGQFVDVDRGETHRIDRTFTVEVPQRYGFISVACAVYESDDETPADRDRLLANFAGNVGSGIVEAEDTFLEVLGESVASGWRLDSVEAVAFRRAPTVEVRSYHPKTFDRWVDGGDRAEWTLSERGSWSVDVPDTIGCGCEACAVDVVLPPVKVDTTPVDLRPAPGTRPCEVVHDAGREVPVDLADVRPGPCRGPADVAVGPVDEVPPPPRPSDGCS